MQAEENIEFICQYCGEKNDVLVDLTLDVKQDFVEDCSVCCRPNRIIITKDYQDNIFTESRQIDG